MNLLGRNSSTFCSLPEDVLLEISNFIEAEDVFALCMTNKRLQAFANSRHLWHKLAYKLADRMPLAIPPLRARSSISTEEFQKYAQHALRLENNWRSECPTPIKTPRYLSLASSKDKAVTMLRLLPGGRIFLLITLDGQLTCRDLRDGRVIGEWVHGGNKIHSIDIDVVDDGKAMILTLSVDSEKQIPSSHLMLEIHTVHVLRLDVIENEGELAVEFVHIMASPWDNPWWIVSVEGDIVAAYSCDMDGRPLGQFVVWIANWRTVTAAVVHLPDSVIHLETWPTLQVVGGQVIIHEERGCLPASIIFPVPDTLFSTESAEPLPHVKITPTLILAGDHEDNAYQTRFSKLWRNAAPRTAACRPISLFSISASVDMDRKRTITVQTFNPFPVPADPPTPTKTVMPKSKVWKRSAFVPESQDSLRFTFCLGRYGSFPVWIEEEAPPPAEIVDETYVPSLRLMGLFTDYKKGGVPEERYMASPEGVPLAELQCMDFDDAEGILCGITELGVWIIEY